MKDKLSRKKIAISASLFVLFYVLLMLLIFVMVMVNSLIPGATGWKEFMKASVSEIILLIVCVFLLFGIVFYFYYFESREFITQPKNVILVLSVLVFSIVLCYVFGRFVSIYARPVALLAFMFVFLLNRRQALTLNFVFSFLMYMIDMYTNFNTALNLGNAVYFSLLLAFVCGTFGVFLAGRNKTRGGLMLTGLFVAIPTFVVVLLLNIPALTSVGWTEGWKEYLLNAVYGVLGSVLSAIFAVSIMPIFERSFNVLTVFRLSELTSTNAPILMRLKKEAPGTFNHSLIVAHLAETCAVAIGENAELARAAGYYHDVGKIKQPDCFTENQGDYNVHDELTPELSADIIRSHAKDGYELLTSAHLPKEIADVAREHHGTLPIKYFYNKAMKLTGEDVDIHDYSYLGPTPQTKIAAIIMIADASEAAVRAMNNRDAETVERIVRGIIEERMDLDQFTNCTITMRELTTIKETIVEALSGVHHHRVKYPKIRFNRNHEAVKDDQ